MLERLDFTVRFITPAFLGDAEQKGVWRTPPFKALLRQWWRIAAAKSYGYDVASLRRAEGPLFGVAADDERTSQKSQVKLRLKGWRNGTLTQSQWPSVQKIGPHDPHVYLGYGPVNSEKGSDGKRNKIVVAAIKPQTETNTLSLLYPQASKQALLETLQLIQWFGTLGSRSRNGWGSLHLEAGNNIALKDFNVLFNTNSLLERIKCHYEHALKYDWPHGIGYDDKGLLVWQTRATRKNWSDVMSDLTKIKLEFRKAIPASKNGFGRRHILAYPVNKQIVPEWDSLDDENFGNKKKRPGRLANQLRFKVHKTEEGYKGIAFHLPCGLPKKLRAALTEDHQHLLTQHEASDWATIHATLDNVMMRIR